MSESLWRATVPPEQLTPRRALPGDVAADVVVVGAGYTGLWTAYALKRAEPALRIVVCEREIAGFGASGRNGGWCSSFFAASREAMARRHGRDAAIAMQRAMFATLDEIERVVGDEAIECDWARGGTVTVATSDAQVVPLHRSLEHERAWGFDDADYRLLEPAEARTLIGCTPNLGAKYSPHCAAVHPFKLARGLADAVERLGVTIHERTPVDVIEPGRVHTRHGDVRAEVVVRATEAWSNQFPESDRSVVPVYSLMVATEPLGDDFWRDAGLATRPTFADFRRTVIYGQRTADGRFAFGGRGAPYHFRSGIRPSFEQAPSVFRDLHETLRSLFPGLGDAAITHRWGGAVAVPHDWYPSVGFDRASGLAWAGGYVGDGVSTTNLAGRTIADLVLGRDTELVRLPWVDHVSPRWEAEPLRWLGINAGRMLAASIDRAEGAGRTPRLRTKAFARLLGEPA
jgi:glycine/D-amino acid oxidase-like deaminating enzyme